jgi:hypothetical protein
MVVHQGDQHDIIWVGPSLLVYFEENANGDAYLEMIQTQFIPELETLLGNEDQRMIFMQDGATPQRRPDVKRMADANIPKTDNRPSASPGLATPQPGPYKMRLFFFGGTSNN